MTNEVQLKALASLRLNWIVRSHDVWEGMERHVPELNRRVVDEVKRGIDHARQERHGNPPGLVLEGEAGTGKTHLLGWVRHHAQRDGGYFFLVTLAHGETFWENVVEAVLDGLWRPHAGSDATQLQVLLRRLGERAGASRTLRPAIEGLSSTRAGLDRFVAGLTTRARLRPEIRDTARALALYASNDPTRQDQARAYFLSDDLDAHSRAELGLGRPPGPERLVRHLSQLLAMTGHSVIAVDQLDPLIVRAASSPAMTDNSKEDAGRDHLVNQIGEGLMSLQEGTQRTLTVLACIPNSWALLRDRGVVTIRDRFSTKVTLGTIPEPAVAQAVVESHLSAQYRELSFTPPYPSWPVQPIAFATAAQRTPRFLLQRIDAHARRCLTGSVVAEMLNFDERIPVPDRHRCKENEAQLLALDSRFEDLRLKADVATALDHRQEDLMMPPLLRAGLMAWIKEQGGSGQEYEPDPPPSSNPPLHAGLRRTLDERVEAQTHRAFRAIASGNALATQTRLRKAMIQSGIDESDDVRRLFIVRNGDWPGGTKTKELVADFVRRGGQKLEVDLDDLRTFEALRVMLNDEEPELESWLVDRKPASSTQLLSNALPRGESRGLRRRTPPLEANASEVPAVAEPSSVPSISVGRDGEARSWLDLESLRKHVAVFAGSGSGKTVLLRRLVEECALMGVSSIVLDPNNDLARLGDAWPEPPPNWRDDDPSRAADYLANTDVVVWTPRREGGRPLTFQPLPDFTSVIDDPDEFRQAVDVAVSALVPRARAIGKTTKAERQKAVLRQAVEHFARQGAGSLDDFIDVLGDLPPEASRIRTAPAIAADMAQTLAAAMVNDPLFGGAGVPVDPGSLLTPPAGKRARISVISFIGLPDEAQRQGFVSQLQMALFAWFKQHPAADRPLGGLLVMDEAQMLAPSGAMTASTESTLVLASQARKYGLGLVFATQAPKGLHNRIPGNAATQFFGYLNSPAQIATAQEFAKMKGGDVREISKLRFGEFYVAREGMPFDRIKTANCLSHHPRSPLGDDEVTARARGW